MKNRNLLSFAFILAAVFGCDEKLEIEQRNHVIFDAYQKNAQVFILSPDKTEPILGNEGTKVNIDFNSLETVDGGRILGDVEIQLIEYYQPEDIILANLSTSSDNNLIETGGMINLIATSNGQEVVVKEGEEFQIEFSSVKKERMETFYGNVEDGRINWQPKVKLSKTNEAGFFEVAQDDLGFFVEPDTASEVAITKADSNVRSNVLKATKFGWINCDRFLELENLTTIKVTYDNVINPSAYFVFNEINSIMPCFYEKTYRKFINLPVGYEATLIAFSQEKEKTYFSSKKVIIEEDMDLKITFKEVSLDQIEENIKKIMK